MSQSDSKESLPTLDSTTNNVKLDTSVVEQLVMAAVAALPTETPTADQTVELPPPTTIDDNSVATTTTTTTTAATTPINDVVTSPQLIEFSEAQLQQINAVQAQALAQSIVNGTADYQQLFANLNDNTTTTTNNTKPKDPITEKVRQENRERKKRWRQQNQDRNKDNDLRCRVNKRALKLFGKEDSPHKRKWVEEEFEKRRSKRKEKEERKLNSPTQQHHTATTTTTNNSAVEGLHSLLTDPYISLLANNLNAFTAAAALTTPTTEAKDDKTSEQLTSQLLEFLQQQQQSHDYAATLVAQNLLLDNSNNQPIVPATEDMEIDEKPKLEDQAIEQSTTTEETNTVKEEKGEDTLMTTETEIDGKKKEGEKQDYPMDAVLTLMQLNAGWRQ